MLETPSNPAPVSDLTRRLRAQHESLAILRFEVERTLRDNAAIRARVDVAAAQRERPQRRSSAPSNDAD